MLTKQHLFLQSPTVISSSTEVLYPWFDGWPHLLQRLKQDKQQTSVFLFAELSSTSATINEVEESLSLSKLMQLELSVD